MFRYVTLLLIVTVSAAAGCGPVIDLFFPPTRQETGSPALKTFQSEQELHDYFLSEIDSRNGRMGQLAGGVGDGVVMLGVEADEASAGGSTSDGLTPSTPTDLAPSPDSAAGDSGQSTDGGQSTDREHSDTTIQEEGVDEADVVKTDGTNAYIIDNGTLRIVQIWPPDELTLLSEVGLEGHGREIYLYNDKIVAITGTDSFFAFPNTGISMGPVPFVNVARDEPTGVDGSGGETPPQYERPRTIVTIIDITSPDDPKVLSQTKFDGTESASRMIDGMLRLVIANHQQYYYDIMPMMGTSELNASSLSVEELLPHFEQVLASQSAGADGAESSGSAVNWQTMYRPTDPDGFGVVSVVSLDVDNDAAFTAVGIVAEPGLIYSSTEALYLTDTSWDFFGETRETTDIYKLAYGDVGVTPVATGSVQGRILNQYSMSEHEGYLRVATTVGPTFSVLGQRSEQHNNVYVLEEVDGKLEVVGSVQNIAPREDIRSARFVGDRGYVVTFEQIDPLFTLDLSDPTDPRVVGELKVPGFSTFIVPMDVNHLLTVGQYVPTEGEPGGGYWGVQLSIFDVSDFANPVRSHNLIIGDETGATSEALYDPKAFTYYAQGGLVALPVSIYEGNPVGIEIGGPGPDDDVSDGGDGGGTAVPPVPASDTIVSTTAPERFDGLVVYEVSIDGGFVEAGRVSTRFEQADWFWSSFTRGLFIEDQVFAVTEKGLRGGPVTALAEPLFELYYGLSDPIDILVPGGVGGASGSADADGGGVEDPSRGL